MNYSEIKLLEEIKNALTVSNLIKILNDSEYYDELNNKVNGKTELTEADYIKSVIVAYAKVQSKKLVQEDSDIKKAIQELDEEQNEKSR